jgi:hypothetical protein
MNTQKIILSEVNRMREIMKLPLLLEGGGIGGMVDTFWDNIFSKSFDDLTTQEKSLLNDLIDNTPSLRRFGDGLSALSDANRQVFIREVRNNADEIATSLQRFATKGVSEIQSSINRNMAKVNNLRDVALQTDLKNIAKSNFNTYRAYELELIKTRLQKIVDETSNAEAKSLAKMGLEGVDNQLAFLKTKASTITTKADAAPAVIETAAQRSEREALERSAEQRRLDWDRLRDIDLDADRLIREYEADPIFQRLEDSQKEIIREFIQQEARKGGKTLRQIELESDQKIQKFFQNEIVAGRMSREDADKIIKTGKRFWPGWKIAVLAFVILAPASAIGFAKGWFKDAWKAITDDETGEYEGNLDGFKKFVEAEVQAAGYTPDEIDGDYVLKPNGYDENPEYYKDYLQKFKYEDGTFKQK